MPITLLDLPNELLGLVAGNFALLEPQKPVVQYSRGHDVTYHVTEGHSSDRQSLLALSATCRRLRDAVQPLLYHAAYPDTAEIEFARTLEERPDLAAQVRELYYSSHAHEDRQSRLLYTKPVNQHLLKQSKSSGKSNFNELVAKHPQGPDLESLWEDENGKICGKGFLGRWEDVDQDYYSVFNVKERILERNLLVQTLYQVPELRELTLWYEPFDIKRLPSGILPRLRHLRVFKPDLSWGEDSYVIQCFSEAMPNLQILDCHFVAHLITEKSSTITELNLNCCPMTRKDFDQVATGFTSLRKLSYHISPHVIHGSQCVSARGVCEALYPRRDTLQDLSIWVDGPFSREAYNILGPMRAVPDYNEIPSTSTPGSFFLPRLTLLERLSLNADAVSDLLEEFPEVPLGSFLPRTLQHVEICLGGTEAVGVQPYLDWLAVRTDGCPNLHSVTICHHLPEPQPEIADLFRATGATYSCRQAYGRDEDKLTGAHVLDPMSQLRNYDSYPGWRFWDPEVESMTFLDEIQDEIQYE